MRKKNTIVNFRYFWAALGLFLLLQTFIKTNLVSAETDISKKLASNEIDHLKEPAIKLYEFYSDFNKYVPPTRAPSTTQSSLTPTSTVFDPNRRPTTEVSSLFEKVTQKIHASCTTFGKGVVRSNNSYCVEPIAPIVGTEGNRTVAILKQSANAYYNLQCVGCAVAAAQANGAPYMGWGNAKQHANQLVLGYTFVPSPQAYADPSVLIPGSLFVMTGGAYGHIGMVTEVEGKAFYGFECNMQPGYVGHRERLRSIDSVAGFQIPN